MSVYFHKLKIKTIKKETTDCVSVVFEVPAELSSTFIYKEGQNLTIKKLINGEEVRRSYSICSAPHEKELKIAVKKVEGGKLSSYMNDELKDNDILEVMPPSGKFNADVQLTHQNHLAIAAGSGITPIISIIKHVLQQNDKAHFTLIYGSKSRPNIIFFEELENLKNRFIDRFTFINILSREKTDADIFYGRVDENKLHQLKKLIEYKNINTAYLCGPESMIFTSRDFLKLEGVPEKNIHFELFTTPGQSQQQKNKIKNEEIVDLGPQSNISIKLDGRTFSFPLAQNGNNILDAALQVGADLPYACKGGVCCTCRAKLLEGKVSMDVNYALEQEEIEQGFILTCQSHPTSENVVIDFDVK